MSEEILSVAVDAFGVECTLLVDLVRMGIREWMFAYR